ncbi:MAG TPA: hypothetical protein VGN72_10425 [Tepidisphaeraceae bacterium]|jgi:DNA-binding NtrC family response regulator|nr:hypothetical protein [Tepidisphaeraceae bacterium]
MTIEHDILSVLAVDCPPMDADDALSVTDVPTARAALAALRVMQFDLIVTTTTVAGEPVWPLMSKVRAVRPKLRWVMMSAHLSLSEEVKARSMGVAHVLSSRAGTRDSLVFGSIHRKTTTARQFV